MPHELLLFDVADRIATITVNRPDKLNALNDALMAELGSAMREALHRSDVGAVLVTGAGRAFVAGADIGELVGQGAAGGKARAERGQRTFRLFETSPKPTLAAVNGSFGRAGGLVDDNLATAVTQTQPKVQDAASQASKSLRDAGAAAKAKADRSAG